MRLRCPKCNKYSNNKKMICHNCSYRFIVPSFFEYNVLGKSLKELIQNKVFSLLILIFLIIPFVIVGTEYMKYHDYVKVSGEYVKCVDFESRIGCKGIYRYHTDDFIYYVKESYAHTFHKNRVNVYYNPKDSTDAIIYSNKMFLYSFNFIFMTYLFIIFDINKKRKSTSL